MSDANGTRRRSEQHSTALQSTVATPSLLRCLCVLSHLTGRIDFLIVLLRQHDLLSGGCHGDGGTGVTLCATVSLGERRRGGPRREQWCHWSLGGCSRRSFRARESLEVQANECACGGCVGWVCASFDRRAARRDMTRETDAQTAAARPTHDHNREDTSINSILQENKKDV